MRAHETWTVPDDGPPRRAELQPEDLHPPTQILGSTDEGEAGKKKEARSTIPYLIEEPEDEHRYPENDAAPTRALSFDDFQAANTNTYPSVPEPAKTRPLSPVGQDTAGARERSTSGSERVVISAEELEEVRRNTATEAEEEDGPKCRVFSAEEVADLRRNAALFEARMELRKTKRWNRLKVDRHTREGREAREKLFAKLWPNGIESPMKQGPVGDCYAVSALDCLKHWHDGKDRILDSIREVGNGRYIVHFFDADIRVEHNGEYAGDGDWVPVEISEADLQAPGNLGLKEGSLGDRLIERAFMRFYHERRGGTPGMTMMANSKDDLVITGGQPNRALYHMAGPDFKKIKAREKELMTQLQNMDIEKRRTGRMSMTMVGSKEKIQPFPRAPKRGLARLLELKKRPFRAQPTHAYRISDVDLRNDEVTLVNPHNTSREEVVSVAEFLHYFNRAYAVQEKTGDESPWKEGRTGIVE